MNFWLRTLLSALMNLLLGTTYAKVSGELVDFFHRNKIDRPLLERLKMFMMLAATMLNDAEEKQFIDPSMKEWIHALQKAVYEADDLLDRIVAPTTDTTEDKVRQFFEEANPLAEGLKSQLDRILDMLTFLVENKDRLGLKEGGVGKSLSLAPATTCLVDEHVFGRDQDSEKIVDFLLSGDTHGKRVSVVAIVGMGGIGKTTLAQMLYNDNRVRNHFQLTSWASISETSGVCQTTKTVFESFMFGSCCHNITDLNVLQLKLQNRLATQRFLLVLDGFWNENFLDWDDFQRPFLSGGRGSKIIVTTRSQSVAIAIRADLTHPLSILSDEDTWALLSSHAFKPGDQDQGEYPALEQIGKQIAKKCKGLPLAAKALGSLLRSKSDTEEWENISNSEIWELPIHKSSILPALRLSYIRLPSLLKRCFAYCSIFPKGHKIDKWNLVYLWMAEGILPESGTETDKRREDVGDECFQELLSRSFFYRSTGDKPCFMMHDLVSDLAQFVAGDLFYNKADNSRKIKTWVRHLSYTQEKLEDPVKFEPFIVCRELRTFLPFSSTCNQQYNWSAKTVTLLNNNRLRVLSLSNYLISNFPSSMTNTKRLRYLNLANTNIECLPPDICSWYNLETLILSSCNQLKKLPDDMFKLANLRHLDLSKCQKIEMMPERFGELKSLQVLTDFFVSREGAMLSELGKLELHGALTIANLQSDNVSQAPEAILHENKHLHEFVFKWKTETLTDDAKSNSESLLSSLKPHENVKMLTIEGFGGNTMPNWLGNSVFSRMVFLNLKDCQSCTQLPSLGELPSLKQLCIEKMKGLRVVGTEFYGKVSHPFKSLKKMEFKDMHSWEEWSAGQSESFPSLSELCINNCPALAGKLPDQLPSLGKLVISNCGALKDLTSKLPKLRELWLVGCGALESLSTKMMEANKCLEIMNFTNCFSLTTICRDGLPCTLRTLKISNCSNLKLFHPPPSSSMQECHYYPALKHLHLKSCASLNSFSLPLFTNLEELLVQQDRINQEGHQKGDWKGKELDSLRQRFDRENFVKLSELFDGKV